MFPHHWTPRQRIVRGIIAILIVIIITMALAEAALWVIDPLGIATALSDQGLIVTIPNAEGYTLAPGHHRLRYWSFTIDANGNRVMPASSAQCHIAFVGDSVTFGQGVNDDQTFAYRFASEHPEAAFINAAKIAYSIANVTASIANHRADGYIYFITDNDDGLAWARPESDWGKPRDLPPRLCALCYYYSASLWNRAEIIVDRPAFWRALETLVGRDDVLMMAMGSPLADDIALRYPDIPVIPRWGREYSISWIDWHPNPAGHEALLEQMRPRLEAFLSAVCDE